MVDMRKAASIVFVMTMLFIAGRDVFAQGVDSPLRVQGLDRYLDVGAASLAMGGAHVGGRLGVNSVFFDPAGLTALDRPELRLGLLHRTVSAEQEQRWTPNRFHIEISLIMENHPVAVNRPFDDIGPGWSRTASSTRPSSFAAAAPFRLGGLSVYAGAGYATVLDLDHYFQNNNVLDPNIGQFRPEPLPRIQQNDTLEVQWFQHIRERQGFVSAFTPALAVEVVTGISLGGSVSILTGSSTDFERRYDRGHLTLRYNNALDLEPATFVGERSGESTYSGMFATFSGRYEAEHFKVGVSVRTPFELKREWNAAGSVIPGESMPTSGTDILDMPLMLSAGLSITPTDRWLLSATMDRRGYDEVTFMQAGSTVPESPWAAGNAIRLGVEFAATPWLALRGGFRDAAASFVPEGVGLLDEPARTSHLGAGFGLTFDRFGFDVAYEHARTAYEDLWLSNTNVNRLAHGTVVFETFVRL